METAKKKILAVDDNPVMLKFMDKLMQTNGHEIKTAKDAYTALNVLVSFTPDIIFVDLFMPKIGGNKLCQIIRKMPHLKHTYLVIISAAIAEMNIDCESMGANCCIAKGPFNEMTSDILNIIEACNLPDACKNTKLISGNKKAYTPRRMTRELLSQKEDLETILDSIKEGILEIFSGKIVYANSAAVDFFNRSEAEVLARDFEDLFEPEDHFRIKRLFGIGSKKPVDIFPDNPITLNNRQVAIKHFPKNGFPTTSIVLLSDVTDDNAISFHKRHRELVETTAVLLNRIHKSFRNQLDGIDRCVSKMIRQDTMDPAEKSRIKKIDQYCKCMTALNRQISELATIKEINLSNPQGPIRKGNEKVLLIDAEPIARDFHRLMLKRLGYGVIIAKSGKEAIQKYRVRSDKKYNTIDMVILDGSISDMTCDDICKKLILIKPDINILLSGNATSTGSKAVSNMAAGIEFLHKPFRIDGLAEKLRKILDRA